MNEVVVPINNISVFMAAVASMVIGALWYGPLFGKMWMAEMGLSKSDMEKAKNNGMAKSYGLMFLGSLVMAYVLAHVTVFASAFTGATGAGAGVTSGLWNWLGFIVPVTLGSVLWEGKSINLWLLNSGYYLVTLVVMGVILATWV